MKQKSAEDMKTLCSGSEWRSSNRDDRHWRTGKWGNPCGTWLPFLVGSYTTKYRRRLSAGLYHSTSGPVSTWMGDRLYWRENHLGV